MGNQKLNFADFETEQLSKNQQKSVRGGDSPILTAAQEAAQEAAKILLETAPTDPTIGQGKGMG
ncbi:rSAM-modified peptide [Flavobacterium sp. FlaQc-57]|uniref:rSAM-modified peptide n=1 Tax=Flavobacterium sp. FlaQc-57 TaxID=3374186 RepID=UPI0037563381